MKIFRSVILFMMAIILALSGCTTTNPGTYNSNSKVRDSLEQIRTSDPTVIKKRWGAYSEIVDKAWINEDKGIMYWRDLQWIVPGAVISEIYGSCENYTCTKGERLIQYNITSQRIERFTGKGELRDIGQVYNDGKVIFVFPGYPLPSERVQFDPVKEKYLVDIWAFNETTREKLTSVTGFSRIIPPSSQQNINVKQTRQSLPSSGKGTTASVTPENKIASTKTNPISSNLKVPLTSSAASVKSGTSIPASKSDTADGKVSRSHNSMPTSKSFTSGSYQVEGGSYRIQIEQRNGDLIVTEPNKTSPYKRQSDGTYHFYNQNNNTTYGLRIIDGQTIEAFKPFVNGSQPTRLFLASKRLAAPSAGPGSAKGDAISAIARKYEALAKSEPSNAHIWATCASIARARAVMNDTEFIKYEKISTEMIKPIMISQSNPCPDAISNW